MNKKQPIVYVDMDGVLVNLYGFLAKQLNVSHHKEITREKWDDFFMNADAYTLFRDLPAFDTANQLLQMVVDMYGSYRILSSPLSWDKPNSIHGKREWLDKNITVLERERVFEHNKYLYALQEDGTPNILIDDWAPNIHKWNEVGGIGIKFQSDEQSLDWLKAELEKYN